MASGTRYVPPRAGSPWRWVGVRFDQVAVLAGVLVVGAATFLFAALLESVIEGGELSSWDRPLLDRLIAHRTSGLDQLFRVITDLGGTPVLPVIGLLVAGVVARSARSWRPLALMVGTMVGSALLTSAVKGLVARPRPPVGTALTSASGYAFPSGHTANTTAVIGACAVLLWAYRRVRAWTTPAAVTLVVLVGFSRLYLGVHWLTDVIAGYALGLGLLAAGVTLFHVLGRVPARPGTTAGAYPAVTGAPDRPC